MENSRGVYINIIEKLNFLIPKIKKNFDDISSNVLHIIFSCNGAQIIKQKLILNLTFTEILQIGFMNSTLKWFLWFLF